MRSGSQVQQSRKLRSILRDHVTQIYAAYSAGGAGLDLRINVMKYLVLRFNFAREPRTALKSIF